MIRVGGSTEVEVKERKDRVDDALHATRAAVEEGIVPGGGVALARASLILSKLQGENDDQRFGIEIVRKAVQTPLRQIAENAGEDGAVIAGKTLDKDEHAFGFDAQTGEFKDLVQAGIIDPTKVVRTALQNAASVAGLLVTTEAMVAERPEKKAAANATGWRHGRHGRHGFLIANATPPKHGEALGHVIDRVPLSFADPARVEPSTSTPCPYSGRLQAQLFPQMAEPAWVHRTCVEHELPQRGQARFSQECRIADAPRSDLDQAAIQHGPSRRRQFGLAFLRAGFPGAEKKTVGDLRAGAEVNPEFLAQPSALGEGEGGGRRLGGWAHAGKKGRPTATRKRLAGAEEGRNAGIWTQGRGLLAAEAHVRRLAGVCHARGHRPPPASRRRDALPSPTTRQSVVPQSRSTFWERRAIGDAQCSRFAARCREPGAAVLIRSEALPRFCRPGGPAGLQPPSCLPLNYIGRKTTARRTGHCSRRATASPAWR